MANIQRLIQVECEKIKQEIRKRVKAEVLVELCPEFDHLNKKKRRKSLTKDKAASGCTPLEPPATPIGKTHQDDMATGTVVGQPVGAPNVLVSGYAPFQPLATPIGKAQQDDKPNGSVVGQPVCAPNSMESFQQRLDCLEAKQDHSDAMLEALSWQVQQGSRQPLQSVSSVARPLTAEEKAKGVPRLQVFFNNFAKRALRGCGCKYFRESSSQWFQTHYRIDSNLENLVIASLKDSTRAEMTCPLSDIQGIHALAEEGGGSFPFEVVAMLTPEEQKLLLMIVYRSGQSEMHRLLITEQSPGSRDMFVEFMRILCIYAQPERQVPATICSAVPRRRALASVEEDEDNTDLRNARRPWLKFPGTIGMHKVPSITSPISRISSMASIGSRRSKESIPMMYASNADV